MATPSYLYQLHPNTLSFFHSISADTPRLVLSPVLLPSGILLSSPEEKCRMFLDQFYFYHPACPRGDENLTLELQVSLDSQNLSPLNAGISLDELNANIIRRRSKAMCSDSIHNEMIFRLSATNRAFLPHLSNLCLSN